MQDWYRLRLAGLNDSLILKLMKDYTTYGALTNEDEKKLREYYKLETPMLEKIYTSKDIKIENTLEKYDSIGMRVVACTEAEYPHLLRNTATPPPFLYMKGKGKISDKSIGVVGTRKMTSIGKGACEYIVKGLAKSGVSIISGLALGVDALAHRITIDNGSVPVAVVGNGLDIIYPASNRKLYERVEAEGLILSELPLGTEPARWTFPQRNRIIAGLSRGVLVVESYESGGSLITAKIALDEGRDVFAIPGMINYPSFEGCNNLIKRGEAKLVAKVEDILEEFDWSYREENKKIRFESIDEEIIYNELITPKSLDELIVKTKLKASDLLILLSNMELEGYVKSISGGKFSRSE